MTSVALPCCRRPPDLSGTICPQWGHVGSVLPWKHRPGQCTVCLLTRGVCIHMAREWRSTAAYRGCACCAVRSTNLFWDICLTWGILIWLREGMAYLATGRWLKQTHSNEGTSVAPRSARQFRTITKQDQAYCPLCVGHRQHFPWEIFQNSSQPWHAMPLKSGMWRLMLLSAHVWFSTTQQRTVI